LTRQNKWAEAAAAYEQGIRHKPGHASAHHLLGDVLAKQGKLAEAEAAYRQAIRLQPDAPGSHHNLGDVLARQDRFAEAEAAYRQAVRLKPDAPAAHHHLGSMLVRQGKLAEAATAFQEAVRLKPDFASAHSHLGSIQARLGEWDKAAAGFARAVALNHQDPLSWMRGATLNLHIGDVEGYRHGCGAVLKRFAGTDDPRAADLTAKTCLLLPDSASDRGRVLKLADRAVTGSEKHPLFRWFVLDKGLADYRAGRYTATVERVRQFAPNANGRHADATAFAVLAMAQHRLGQSQEASAALTKARAILAKYMPDPARGRPFADDWHSWLHSQILCREAEALLKKGSAVKDHTLGTKPRANPGDEG
jgi:Tfp pilus assembly protein PilF